MAQVLTQTQTERLSQQMRLSQQQLQVVKLLEMPIAELEQQVKEELMGNPALEEGRKSDVEDDAPASTDTAETTADDRSDDDDYSDFDAEAAASEVAQYSSDDLPLYATGTASAREEENVPFGDEGSFIEDLEAQMVNYNLTDDEEKILKYLIGSLDNRGYIDRPLSALADEIRNKLSAMGVTLIDTKEGTTYTVK